MWIIWYDMVLIQHTCIIYYANPKIDAVPGGNIVLQVDLFMFAAQWTTGVAGHQWLFAAARLLGVFVPRP